MSSTGMSSGLQTAPKLFDFNASLCQCKGRDKHNYKLIPTHQISPSEAVEKKLCLGVMSLCGMCG